MQSLVGRIPLGTPHYEFAFIGVNSWFVIVYFSVCSVLSVALEIYYFLFIINYLIFLRVIRVFVVNLNPCSSAVIFLWNTLV
jgi:hypothetical protein